MEVQETTAKDLLDKIAPVIIENFVAICKKTEDNLLIRSVGGKTFRLTIEEL